MFQYYTYLYVSKVTFGPQGLVFDTKIQGTYVVYDLPDEVTVLLPGSSPEFKYSGTYRESCFPQS